MEPKICRYQVYRGGFGRLNSCGTPLEADEETCHLHTPERLAERAAKKEKSIARLKQEHADMKAFLQRCRSGGVFGEEGGLLEDARALLAKIEG